MSSLWNPHSLSLTSPLAESVPSPAKRLNLTLSRITKYYFHFRRLSPVVNTAWAGLAHQGACGGKGGYTPSAAAVDLWRKADVRLPPFPWHLVQEGRTLETCAHLLIRSLRYRADDRTAAEYKLEGGATLHLVLALRGGN